MTAINGLAVVAFVLMASPPAVAQQSTQSQAEWQRMSALGIQHRTAWDLYMAMTQATGGARQSPPFDRLPDWSGLWTAAGGGSFFDRGPGGVSPKLTPAAAAALKQGADLEARGISYDENLSECGPPGFPRWLIVPFLREFIVRPEQTWLSSETVNNVRRIYTDGRGHVPQDDRYPLYYGDSIGTWDGQKLVIHTNQLQAGVYQRSHPDYTDQVETVEIWRKVDNTTLGADVWVYDPPALVEPWYTKQSYLKLSDPDKNLRIRYWNCGENQNNSVIQTKAGATEFRDLTFARKNGKQGDKP